MTPDPVPADVDPSRCPLCGNDNACGAARGSNTCWCYSTHIPDSVIERIPASHRDRACVCERCAAGERKEPVGG
ncbi:MAG: cysteine-rich CWC family protein [Acidobacteria bacterium]|nr:cysteine-rich CWC family protein [Acidobacteriota bacterium]